MFFLTGLFQIIKVWRSLTVAYLFLFLLGIIIIGGVFKHLCVTRIFKNFTVDKYFRSTIIDMKLIKYRISRSLVTVGLGLSSIVLSSPSALSAEKVKLIYGPFNGRISVESLEKYATTGEMTHEFRLYAKFVDRQTLAQLRYWLNNRFECDRVEMYRFTNTPEGEKFLKDLGTAIKTHPQRNGFYAIRSALIAATDEPTNSDGWTAIEAMQNFPTEDLQIDTKKLFKLQKYWSDKQNSNRAALEIFAPRTN